MRRTTALLAIAAAAVFAALVLAGRGAGATTDEPFTATAVAVGNNDGCALVDDGTVQCWGRVSDGDGQNALAPVPVASLAGATQLTSGCALVADTTVRCWGENFFGQLGDESDVTSWNAVEVVGITGATQVSRFSDHSCAVLGDTTVRCWGLNDFGQLGDGTNDNSASAVAVSGLTGVAQVAAGAYHTCAALLDGTAQCWGAGGSGQLGNGSTTNSSVPTPVSGLTTVESVAVGLNHSCALLADGTVRCWGHNGDGQLGTGSTTGSTIPATVTGLSGVANIDVGFALSCASLDDNTARCWGDNQFGQVGDGTTTDALSPAAVAVLNDVQSVDAGFRSACAALTGGGVRCWGTGAQGALGNGSGFDTSVPVRLENRTPHPVEALPHSSLLAAGWSHTCAIDTSAALRCWGANDAGKLGRGAATPTVDYNVGVVDGLSVLDIAPGFWHTCAVVTDGTVSCWGNNSSGETGSTPSGPVLVPAAVPGITTATQVSATTAHTCVRLADGGVRCWGSGVSGQLGDGLSTDSPTPVTPLGLASVSEVATGTSHTCARLADGGVRCWGAGDDGQLGNGGFAGSPTPAVVVGLSEVIALEAGFRHNCAITSTNAVYCWGNNERGQLGDGTVSDRSTPVLVPGISASALALGESHTCALLVNGTVSCWGANDLGQLGDASTAASSTPVTAAGLSGVTGIAAGEFHTCALDGSADAHCWGGNASGQLGTILSLDPPPAPTPTPTATPTATPGPTPTPPAPFTAIAPARLLDTRPDETTTPGTTITLDVAGQAGIPADAEGVVLNVTAVNPGGQGFVTVHPCVDPRPGTASLNHPNGVTTGNEIVATLDAQGDVCLYTHAATDLTVDAVAYLHRDSPYVPVGPKRLLDTRDTTALTAGVASTVVVGGDPEIPVGVTAAVLNITAINPAANGFLTAYACTAGAPPTASSLNYRAGVTRGNEVVAPLAATGALCLFSNREVDVTVDVVGYVPAGTAYHAVTPARLMETRSESGLTTIDGVAQGDGRLAADEQRVLPVANRAEIPATAGLAVLNVTAVNPAANGFVVVHPCFEPRPTTASLNYRAGVTAGSEIIAEVGDTGSVCVYTNRDTDLTIDVVGWVDGPGTA